MSIVLPPNSITLEIRSQHKNLGRDKNIQSMAVIFLDVPYILVKFAHSRIPLGVFV
jgi:hypothetical protein